MRDQSVYFVSLGCPKNLVDSQVMLGLLKEGNYTLSPNPETAQVIVVNTCSFIQASKEESIETILEMASHKQSGKCETLVVTGCLPQRYARELQAEMPEVDLLLGTGQYNKITEALTDLDRSRSEGTALPRRAYIDQPAFIHTERDPRMHTGPAHSAFLKLSEGCNRRCAFCIIPKLRGNVRSRSIASLVAEATQLASRGVKELNLVAQDLTEYGMEWKYRERLEMLLPELCKIDGIEWIRLHYVYPDEFSDELIDILSREPKIVKYLDMPIQHTVDRVLKLMNRRLTKERLFALVQKLREKIPGIVFRTSMIVGFPSETEAEFQELARDLEALAFDYVGIFRYSQEEGTPAAGMPDQVHPSTKRRRARTLIELLQKQSQLRLADLIGKTERVMIEGISEESDSFVQARLSTQAHEIDGNVLINDWPGLVRSAVLPGQMIDVEITEALPYQLIARVIA